MDVSQFLRAEKLSIYGLCKATGIAYSTLHPHVARGKPLSDKTAKKLEAWSRGKMNACQILGLTPPALPIEVAPSSSPRPAARSSPSPRKAKPLQKRKAA